MTEVVFDNPEGGAAPLGAYSHIAIVPGGSQLLVVAGQVGNAADGSVPAEAVAQYEAALRNVVRILASHGAGPEDIVKLNTYLVEKMDLPSVRAVRQSVLGAAAPPATMVYVAGLAAPEYLVEVEAWAVRPGG